MCVWKCMFLTITSLLLKQRWKTKSSPFNQIKWSACVLQIFIFAKHFSLNRIIFFSIKAHTKKKIANDKLLYNSNKLNKQLNTRRCSLLLIHSSRRTTELLCRHLATPLPCCERDVITGRVSAAAASLRPIGPNISSKYHSKYTICWNTTRWCWWKTIRVGLPRTPFWQLS